MTDAPTSTTNQPFYSRQGDVFSPNPVANGPWDPKSLHGRVIIGLLALVIEGRHSGPDFVPARLTVDMFRLPDIFKPIEVKTKLIRDGLRIVPLQDVTPRTVAIAWHRDRYRIPAADAFVHVARREAHAAGAP